jgi:hypothetical protein
MLCDAVAYLARVEWECWVWIERWRMGTRRLLPRDALSKSP